MLVGLSKLLELKVGQVGAGAAELGRLAATACVRDASNNTPSNPTPTLKARTLTTSPPSAPIVGRTRATGRTIRHPRFPLSPRAERPIVTDNYEIGDERLSPGLGRTLFGNEPRRRRCQDARRGDYRRGCDGGGLPGRPCRRSPKPSSGRRWCRGNSRTAMA